MPRHAIILNLEHLSRRCLGFYGHEWIETPHLDQIASRGVVFDQCFSSPAPLGATIDRMVRLCEHLQDKGIVVRQIRETEAIETDDVCKTSLAQLLAEAECTLAKLSHEMDSSWLLVVEASGIGWPGVATTQFAELYADELDDDLPEKLSEIREIETAYAALLTQFDHLLGGFFEMINRLTANAPPLIVFMANHGQSICEAEMLASYSDRFAESEADAGAFRDELVHVPLVILDSTRKVLGDRRQELVTPADLIPTLAEWFGTSEQFLVDDSSVSLWPLLRNDQLPWRSEVFLRDEEGHAALRTQDVLFVQTDAVARLEHAPGHSEFENDESGWLWLKPEDVWEVSEVSSQHPEEVATLRAVLKARLRSR